MPWDSRGYYYRARKVGGRVMREYVGRGPIAHQAANQDVAARARRKAQRAAWLATRAALDTADRALADLARVTDLAAHAALRACGYHPHRRQWRKRRARP